jgi:hypothetical protein
MADQDDESTLSAFAGGFKKGASSVVSGAAKGASLAANTVRDTVQKATSTAFGLGKLPGEDHSGFPY